jgi:hypothetical protein
MPKTTKTGYDFIIRGFIEYDPEYMFATVDKNQKATVDPKTARDNIQKAMAENGFLAVEIKTDYRARKTIEDADQGRPVPHHGSGPDTEE